MKKMFSCLLAVLMLGFTFTACTGQEQLNDPDKLKIVTTIFPQYDWVKQILGDQAEHAELTLLIDNGVDLHSYQPTTDDIIKISTCDVFIYVGGESDSWVKDALKTATNKNMVVIDLLEVMGEAVKEEEIKEGMEHDHAHSHDEVDPAIVKDRPLSDWQGDWSTIERALEKGALDAYIAHQAEENEVDAQAQKITYTQRWKSDYDTIRIDDNTVTLDDQQAEYRYIGYKIVESDQGASVWYGFEIAGTSGQTPKYLALSDHGTGGDTHEEEEHGEAEHFHLRYGNESFEVLTAIEGWAPTYFGAATTQEEIAEAMSGHSHEGELDEHVWLSLKNAQTLTRYIADRLGEVDAKNADLYEANLAAYQDKLIDLYKEFNNVVSSSANRTLLFADRFPFRYLVDEYGLDYYAAFSGCSAETEASFETIVFLADKVNALDLSSVMVIETSDQSIAKTVVQNTKNKNQKILVLNSLQSVTAADIAAGASYLGMMEENLAVLNEALNPH